MPMEYEIIMHWIAQGAINITEGLTTIEADSPVHMAMQELCRLANEGKIYFDMDECADCGESTAVGTPDPHQCTEGS